MRPRTSTILIALSVAVAALQLWMAHRYFGFLTGDDVEILGEAFRTATGYGYRAWDIRNLFVPQWLVAPPIWLASHLGVRDVATLIEIATLPFIALNIATIWLVHRLALHWSANATAALLAPVLFALHWLPLAFGSTVYPRTLAAFCIVAAALLVEEQPFAAGLLAGIAFADRFSEIVFFAPLFLIARRRGALLAGAAVSIGLTTGIHDWIVWGAPFSSVRKFAHLTLVAPDFASRIKVQSPFWYVGALMRWLPLTLLPFLWVARRRLQPLLFIILPLAALSLIRHKELRYLQGIIPFVAIAAAIGFTMINRRIAIALLALSIPWGLYGLKVVRKKSMPGVMAARSLRADGRVHSVIVSQQWAYGDRLYFGDRIGIGDVGTPPRAGDLDLGLNTADAACLYETDLDDPKLLKILSRHRFIARQTFRDGPARAVIVFSPSVSEASDRGH